MNRLIILAVTTFAFAAPASAQTVNSGSWSDSDSSSGAAAVINNTSKGGKFASSAIAPSMGTSGCSDGIGIGGAGSGLGLSFGIPIPNANCDTREDAKYILGATGDTAAAKERLCDNRKIAAAFARAGRPCVGKAATYTASTRAIRSQPRSYGAPNTGEVTTSDPVLARWCARQPASNRPVRCYR